MKEITDFSARLVSAVLSWLSAADLRNELYRQRQRNEILIVALDDITRIDPEGLAGKVARQALQGEDIDESIGSRNNQARACRSAYPSTEQKNGPEQSSVHNPDIERID